MIVVLPAMLLDAIQAKRVELELVVAGFNLSSFSRCERASFS
jgi:hypothetical protein